MRCAGFFVESKHFFFNAGNARMNGGHCHNQSGFGELT